MEYFNDPGDMFARYLEMKEEREWYEYHNSIKESVGVELHECLSCNAHFECGLVHKEEDDAFCSDCVDSGKHIKFYKESMFLESEEIEKELKQLKQV